jgi:fructose-1,6-bisphosphatase
LPTNIESEGIGMPRATFGGSKMVKDNFQYQFEQEQYILEYHYPDINQNSKEIATNYGHYYNWSVKLAEFAKINKISNYAHIQCRGLRELFCPSTL